MRSSLTVSARGRVDALARCAQKPDAVAATQRDALRPAMAEHEGVPAVTLLPVRTDVVLVVRHVEERVRRVAEQVADVAREEVRPHAVLRAR